MRPTQINSNRLTPLRNSPFTQKPGQVQEGGKVEFSEMVEDYVSEVDSLQDNADKALQDIATGKTDNVHQFAVAASQADLSFRLMAKIRNKLVSAYNEIMKMRV